jgi:hypothetical protein
MPTPDDIRRVDRRLDALEAAIRAVAPDQGSTPQATVATVYGNPTAPTLPNRYCSCKPFILGGAEKEGGSLSQWVPAVDMKAFVFGHRAPGPGAKLRLRRVGGRWVGQNWSTPAAGAGYIQFFVVGCAARLPGATVTIAGDNGYTASGTTDATGSITFGFLALQNYAVTYSETSGRFLTTRFNVAAVSGHGSTDPQQFSVPMAVAPGYHCCSLQSKWAYPLKDTLSISGPGGFSATLGYSGGSWSGTGTMSVPACGVCPAKAVTVTALYCGSPSFLFKIKGVSGRNCPDDTGLSGGADSYTSAVTVPPPGFTFTGTIHAPLTSFPSLLCCNGTCTFTITE